MYRTKINHKNITTTMKKPNTSGLVRLQPIVEEKASFDLMSRNPKGNMGLGQFQNIKTAGGTWNTANAFMNNVDIENKPQPRVYQKGNFEKIPKF